MTTALNECACGGGTSCRSEQLKIRAHSSVCSNINLAALPPSYVIDMIGHALQCVDRYGGLDGTAVATMKNVTALCIYVHPFSDEAFTEQCVFASKAARTALTCLYFALHGTPAILWSVHYLAREVARWTRLRHHTLQVDNVQPPYVGLGSDEYRIHLRMQS